MRSVIEAVVDTSVLVTFALGEHHQVDEDQVLAGAAVSAVNLAEFRSILRQKQVDPADIDASLRDFNLKVLAFGAREAEIAGRLIPLARPLNIGLGDCACLATGLALDLPVWTADRDWTRLEGAGDIKLIR